MVTHAVRLCGIYQNFFACVLPWYNISIRSRWSVACWYHTVLVCGFDGDEILVCAQSDNARNRPLSSYTNAVNYRFLQIEGVRIEINDDLCYQTLLAGEALPPPEEGMN